MWYTSWRKCRLWTSLGIQHHERELLFYRRSIDVSKLLIAVPRCPCPTIYYKIVHLSRVINPTYFIVSFYEDEIESAISVFILVPFRGLVPHPLENLLAGICARVFDVYFVDRIPWSFVEPTVMVVMIHYNRVEGNKILPRCLICLWIEWCHWVGVWWVLGTEVCLWIVNPVVSCTLIEESIYSELAFAYFSYTYTHRSCIIAMGVINCKRSAYNVSIHSINHTRRFTIIVTSSGLRVVKFPVVTVCV